MNYIQLLPVCPCIIEVLPLARLQHSKGSRSRTDRREATRREFTGTRLSAHKSSLVLQTAIRCTQLFLTDVAAQNNMWAECACLADTVRNLYEQLLLEIRLQCPDLAS